MKIRLPKPDIKCPVCDSPFKIDCGIEHIKKGMSLRWFFECKDCGNQYNKKFVFEEDPLFCNCEVCKKING